MYITKLLKTTVAKMDLEIILEEKALVSSISFKKRGCVIYKREFNCTCGLPFLVIVEE